ncbi:Kinase domain containing protein [Ceratobasidium theobromae]|uniref:Kinase domain containing protein n=1 Tax=Ceratobasidium theobromae TaxID=1582974 RepID=A0A5N5QL88_9AGAM|nr:Kinase domain containing protein [Ceratobasidium theobromae]
MFTWFCIWIKRRKRRAQKEALANGIEIGPDGWPVKPAQAIALPTLRSGNASTVSAAVGTARPEVPPPAYEAEVGKKGNV